MLHMDLCNVNYLKHSLTIHWIITFFFFFGFLFSLFRLNHRDLKPNIGLFWYFFTEMFEHFRTLFLFSFQLNATVLYLVPLTIKLYKRPIFLATILIALTAIFRSYPCVGDIAFYMALFPLWKRSAMRKSIKWFQINDIVWINLNFDIFSYGKLFCGVLFHVDHISFRTNSLVSMDLL